jgi:hypothetical protein
MSYANLDELRFFVDDREEVAERILRTGASTTEVMVAIGLNEMKRDEALVPHTVAEQRIADVCCILRDSDDDAEELSLDDLEWVA